MWEREAASGSHVLPRPPPTHRPSSTAEACSGRSSFATMSQREAGPMIDDAGAARGMGRRQFLQATVASALVGIAARSPLLPRAIRTFDASRRGLPPSAAIQQLVQLRRASVDSHAQPFRVVRGRNLGRGGQIFLPRNGLHQSVDRPRCSHE